MSEFTIAAAILAAYGGGMLTEGLTKRWQRTMAVVSTAAVTSAILMTGR
jgi:hypothetical protein